jgi:ABC-type sugar transport system ATPase subunit
MALGQRLAVLCRGRLKQFDEPSQVHGRPADRFVAEFLGYPAMNLADGVLVRDPGSDRNLRFAAAGGAFHLPMPAELVTHGAEGQPVAVGIRPEHLIPSLPADSTITPIVIPVPDWRVVGREFLPPHWLVQAKLGPLTWRFWSSETASTATVFIPVNRVHWFDGKTGLRLGSEF